MTSRPLVIPLFSAIAGLVTAYLWGIFLPASLLFILLTLTLILSFLENRSTFLIGISLCFFVWGDLALEPYLAPRLPSDSVARYAGEDNYAIDGIIDSRPEWREQGGRICLRAVRLYRRGWTAPVSGRLLLYVGEGRGEYLTGDRVRFISRISRPRNFGVPGEFDYERYLACREVFATAFSKKASDVLLIRAGVDYPFRRMVDAVAADLGNRIATRLPGHEGAVLRALVLGDMGAVPEALRELYTRTGVNHILSISGFHVSVIALFIFSATLTACRCSEYLLLRANLRRLLLALTVPVLLFYLFLTGSAPATIRSVIMVAAYIAALLLERETDPVNSLVLAALVILGCSPPALFDISFQLSFLAIWGILVLTPLLMRPFDRMKRGIPYKLLLFLMVSVAATAATIIPVSYYFHRTTLTGLVSNFFIIPLMGYGAVILGFTSLPLLHVFPVLGGLFLWISGLLVRLSGTVLSFLDRFPLLPVWKTTGFDIFLVVLALFAATFLARLKWRVAALGFLTVLFIAGRVTATDSGAGALRLDFFSVGQGESTLVSFPDGKRMLIDGGGSFREGGLDPGERLLAPALWGRGIDRLDYLVLTHPHPDHLKGLIFIVRNFRIGEFWESGVSDGNEDYLALKRIIAERNIPVRRVNASVGTAAIGAARIEFLAPAASREHAGDEGGGELNESSLVFRLRMREFSVLFTGDIGPETEGLLTRNASALRCTVLKVPHHGSRASSSGAFLDAASPVCALIGAGYGNRFRLPAEETLLRLNQRRIVVYRTDLDGTVSITCDDRNWAVRTFSN